MLSITALHYLHLILELVHAMESEEQEKHKIWSTTVLQNVHLSMELVCF